MRFITWHRTLVKVQIQPFFNGGYRKNKVCILMENFTRKTMNYIKFAFQCDWGFNGGKCSPPHWKFKYLWFLMKLKPYCRCFLEVRILLGNIYQFDYWKQRKNTESHIPSVNWFDRSWRFRVLIISHFSFLIALLLVFLNTFLYFYTAKSLI